MKLLRKSEMFRSVKFPVNVWPYFLPSVSLEMVSSSELKRFGPPAPRKLSWKWTREVQSLKRSNCCQGGCQGRTNEGSEKQFLERKAFSISDRESFERNSSRTLLLKREERLQFILHQGSTFESFNINLKNLKSMFHAVQTILLTHKTEK